MEPQAGTAVTVASRTPTRSVARATEIGQMLLLEFVFEIHSKKLGLAGKTVVADFYGKSKFSVKQLFSYRKEKGIFYRNIFMGISFVCACLP